MSSFKRRVQLKHGAHPLGTRPSPSNHSVSTISTGIPSLDDVLGGGLPLGHVLVILAPDPHTGYGELLQRHFIAQGLASGQNVCILDDLAMDLASGCMWFQAGKAPLEGVDGGKNAEHSEVKIAWRYESMKQFQTTVDPSDPSLLDTHGVPLDLTCRIPEAFVHSVVTSQQLRCSKVSQISSSEDPFPVAMSKVDAWISESTCADGSNLPLRLSIPSLGSPQWGDATPAHVLRFLHALRAQLRGNSGVPHAAALITLPSYISDDEWGGFGWSQKLGWLSDGCITFRSFSADLTLTSMFSSHHGLLKIHMLPSPQTLVPTSDKFSQLRGLSSFSSSSTGGGENNLAFKCTRKRFVIETLHLDVEGGVSERRTSAPIVTDSGPKESPAIPIIQVSVGAAAEDLRPVEPGIKKRAKKSVAFRSDRPELYDF